MKCVIGIDGGGTKTMLRAIDLKGNLICEAIGGPSNLCSNTKETVLDNIASLVKQANINYGEKLIPEAICLGTAGIQAQNAVSILAGALKEATGCSNIIVLGDMELPLLANAPGEDAVVLISGTGSICYAKSADGTSARSGGWGHIVGDEGSGYWIAVESIRAITRAHDFQRKTALTRLIFDKMGCKTVTEVIEKVYSREFGKTQMASLAYLVDIAADEGDLLAIDILNRGAEHLFSFSCAAIKGAGLCTDNFKIFLSGSVILRSEFLKNRLISLLKDAYPNACIFPIEKDAAWGAAHIALNAALAGK